MNLKLELGSYRYPAAFVIALLLSLYLTPIIRKGAIAYGVLDNPDQNLKQHKTPTPYLGGVSIYLAFLFALAGTYDFKDEILGILLPASIIVMIGLFDDLKVLSPVLKLIGQLVAALFLLKAGISIHLTFLHPLVALGLTLLWMVGVTNSINLIDVSDGLAAGVASIAGMFFYWIANRNGSDTIAMLILSLVGATCGFLKSNLPPARIFLGDTGSMFLGFMLAALAMIGHYTFVHPLAATAPIVILGVPIFDTFFVMGARFLRGVPLMRGSPDHYAVRLRNHGVPAARIALGSYIASALLGFAGIGICVSPIEIAATILAGVVLAATGAAVAFARLGVKPPVDRG